MEEAQILDVARDGIMTMILISAPVLLAGLTVGLVISLFQTLTQIQEMTLVFVPKIIVVFLAVLILLPFMIRQLTELAVRLMDMAVSLP
ncbi:flagellar biosynthesis protein FliQ [Roseospira marina]|uniref:Flagellar biosynthetic protein FliQ n=1 Tax=Roseospira marina TaxID=140057 RepID=A0A5M6I8C2_9PROT|nr:flagellar biosynthesis protein FliQ [Roseospira marina]KAA5604510.1 flagellar biosynthesis protein FliQ [Roseospira marina]MBB4315567.1 flagellar biosynthetic protein FliQ [Roseospira marina]MBB5088496.1 flagellar biosynthetic protein FliQ [Roseospira marina]